jgi:gamma-glutamylcysteine synthetase
MAELVDKLASFKKEYRRGFRLNGERRMLGPEIEGILFDPRNPQTVPRLEDVVGLFEKIATKVDGARAIHEGLIVNGKLTDKYPTGVKMMVDGYEIDITTDMSRCTFEVTVPPSSSLARNEYNIKTILGILSNAVTDSGLVILGLGAHPFADRALKNMMPKPRYSFMSRCFKEEELIGMTITAATQFHVEVTSEDAARVLNVLSGFTPALVAATGNSTVIEGEISRYKEYRGIVWDLHASAGSIEKCRVGIPALFKNVDHYIEYLASHAPIITKRVLREGEETYVFFARTLSSFAEFVREGQADAYRMDTGEKIKIVPQFGDLRILEGTVWPDARLRTRFGTVEFRPCAFQPSVDDIMAIGAVVRGLTENSREAEDFLARYTLKEIQQARQDVIVGGFDSAIGGTQTTVVCDKMLNIAARGLNESERKFLNPIRTNLEERMSPADRTRKSFGDDLIGLKRGDAEVVRRFVEKHRFKI